jgi:hypothetical protein
MTFDRPRLADRPSGTRPSVVTFSHRVAFLPHQSDLPRAVQAAQLPSCDFAAKNDLRLLSRGTHLGSLAAAKVRRDRTDSLSADRPN